MRRDYLGNNVEDEIDIPGSTVAAGNRRGQVLGYHDDLNHFAKIERALGRRVCNALPEEPHDFRGGPGVRAAAPFQDLYVALHPGALRSIDFNLPVESQCFDAATANLLALPQCRK